MPHSLAKRKEDLEKRERGFGKNREENLKGRQGEESKNAFCAGSGEALELPLRRTSEQPGKLMSTEKSPYRISDRREIYVTPQRQLYVSGAGGREKKKSRI